MKPGRIGTYVHSDLTTANKGIGVVRVRTETDFAAKDQLFIDFCNKAAQTAFATGALSLGDLLNYGDDLYKVAKGLQDMSDYLGEDVFIDEVWSSAL